jgi:hypothetical protein
LEETEDLRKSRTNLGTKVMKSSSALAEMIEKFETAYVDKFHGR